MKKALWVITGLWLVIIIGFALTQELTLRFGSEILLKTIPIDPRDLLRGDYEILNFEIGQLQQNDFAYNSRVYATLGVNENNIAYVKNVSYKKPEDSLYMKGKVGSCGVQKCIKFGIESYFVKEGSGKKLERELREGALVKVVVDKNGRSKVKGFVK